MPLFSRRTEAEEEPMPVEQPHYEEDKPKRSHGLFGSRREPSPTGSAATNSTYHSTSTRGSADGAGVHRRSTDASHSSSTTTGRRSLLQRTFGNGNDGTMDPSIVQARERVLSAEAAERDADKALALARACVQEARDEVRRLELEAKEEARLAKIKQFHAKEVGKRGKQLGRHDMR